MVNYQLGKIYKIECNVTGLIYIGSTTKKYLSMRLAGHVGNYKCYLNGKGNYITSFKILKNGNYDIILLEQYPCNSKDALLARERHYQETIECVNKCKAGLFNELGKVQYSKQYNEANKEQNKQYKEANKENIQEQNKQYKEANKGAIREQRKQHYEANKVAIQEYKNKKNICECGSCYSTSGKSEHMRTNKHQAYENDKLYYSTICKGLKLIKALDNHFLKA